MSSCSTDTQESGPPSLTTPHSVALSLLETPELDSLGNPPAMEQQPATMGQILMETHAVVERDAKLERLKKPEAQQIQTGCAGKGGQSTEHFKAAPGVKERQTQRESRTTSADCHKESPSDRGSSEDRVEKNRRRDPRGDRSLLVPKSPLADRSLNDRSPSQKSNPRSRNRERDRKRDLHNCGDTSMERPHHLPEQQSHCGISYSRSMSPVCRFETPPKTHRKGPVDMDPMGTDSTQTDCAVGPGCLGSGRNSNTDLRALDSN